MLFRPIDEMSLRHLFSTSYAQEILKLSYVGPVLNASGIAETSPDCLILDKRKSPFRVRRCEFKFTPTGGGDFSHNGKFDIAVIWDLSGGSEKRKLLAELNSQNDCQEVIVLAEYGQFRQLSEYSNKAIEKIHESGSIVEMAKRCSEAKVFALCMAAMLYPDKFELSKMVEHLMRFSDVKGMKPQGRSNVVSAFVQTTPPLIERMHTSHYRWINEYDSKVAAAELRELLVNNYGIEPPSADDLNRVRV